MWTENGDDNLESIVRFFQLLSEKTKTTLRSTVVAAYSVHAILLNVSARMRQLFKTISHLLVECLPVGCTDE